MIGRAFVIGGLAALAGSAPAAAIDTRMTGTVKAGTTTLAEVRGTYSDVGSPHRYQGFVMTIGLPADPAVTIRISGSRYTSGDAPEKRFIALGRIQHGGSYDLLLGRAIVTFANGRPTHVFVGGLEIGGTYVPLLGGTAINLRPE